MSKLTEAVQTDRRTALIAVRDNLAAALDNPDRPAHTTAPLARQLQAVLREIDELPSPDAPLTKLEEFRQRVERLNMADPSCGM